MSFVIIDDKVDTIKDVAADDEEDYETAEDEKDLSISEVKQLHLTEDISVEDENDGIIEVIIEGN